MTFTAGSSPGMGTRFFVSYSGGPPTATNMSALATELATLFSADLAALCATAVTLATTECTDLSSSSGALASHSAGIAGTRGGTFMNVGACVVMDYTIGRRYRGGKPRGYWPFGNTADTTGDQVWSGTAISAFQTGVNSFFTSLLAYGGAGITLDNQVNVSYYTGFTNYTGSGGRAKVRSNQRTTPVVDIVTGHIARATIGSQRRRLSA